MTRISLSALAFLLLTATAVAAAEPVQASGPVMELSRSLERLVPRLMRDGDVPGVSLAVVRGGRIFYQRSFGVRNAATTVALDDDTIFEAASLSKPVFAWAVGRLVDAGRIDLDTPLTRYLPGDYVDDPRLKRVTARHVLSHTAGFPNWRPSGQPLAMHFLPGERFSYSGEGFVYLQKAVEHMTGETLDALMRRLVFQPLEMTSSSFTWEERYDARKAAGHDAIGTPLKIRRPAEALSAATLHTTTGDYAKFLIALLGGPPGRTSPGALSPKTAAEMLRPQIRVDEACSNCIAKKPSGKLSTEIAWGLGVGLEETEDGVAVWHWGDNSSGFHCYLAGYPRRKVGVIVFTNGLGGHGIIPEIVEASIGGRHPAFAWLDYDRWDAPQKAWFKDILSRGAGAAASPPRKPSGAEPALTERQVNQVGYWLIARKRLPEAIAVLERNTRDFPASWNAWDSLGEAYAEDGQTAAALASYEKSVALNSSNPGAAEKIRKLKEAARGR